MNDETKDKPVKADIFDRVAEEIFTPGGMRDGAAPVERLVLTRVERGCIATVTGFGWSREAFADYLRRRLSPIQPRKSKPGRAEQT